MMHFLDLGTLRHMGSCTGESLGYLSAGHLPRRPESLMSGGSSSASQIRPHHTPHNWKVHSLIADIRTNLQDKRSFHRYLIIIDDVWATRTWDIIDRALPAGKLCSGILITTEVDDVALKCCDYDSTYVLTMKPLGQDDSSKLFFSTVFGPQYDYPPVLSEVANNIIRKCANQMVTVASLLANQRNWIM